MRERAREKERDREDRRNGPLPRARVVPVSRRTETRSGADEGVEGHGKGGRAPLLYTSD